jgi:hypothetical protein
MKYLTALHLVQSLLGSQDGQRAVQAAGIQFPIKIHGIPSLVMVDEKSATLSFSGT